MPQFDLSTFLPQVFWLVICFTGLYVFTIGYSVPRLKKAYDERWQHTQGTRIEAVKIHREAQDITAAYEKELEETRQQASHLISTRLRAISQDTIDEKNKILSETKKQFTKGELFLSERKMKAFVESQPVSHMLTTEIIMKLMRDHISSQTVKTMVTQSLKGKATNDQ
jgi:F-type H+-transporting ATPase subunit b